MGTGASAPQAPQRQLAEVEGVLERITYTNEETGYTVARVDTGRGASDLLTVVGALLGAQVGESLRLYGRWGSHSQYGTEGGFNWSSQHFLIMEVCDGTTEEADAASTTRCAAAVGCGQGDAGADALAGPA